MLPVYLWLVRNLHNIILEHSQESGFIVEILKFAPAPVNKKLELGSTAKIHCKAQGTPPPNIRWEKQGVGAEGMANHITDMNGTLHFNGVLGEDKGKYTCTASSVQGKINVTVNIDVVGKKQC